MASRARDEMRDVLRRELPSYMSELSIDRIADALLPIVRRVVARGFEAAAFQFDAHPDIDDVPSGLLRQWAVDARTLAENPSVED